MTKEEEKDAVWNKAVKVSDENDAKGFRKDHAGAWIQYSEYGNRDHKFGWEIDHIRPTAKYGNNLLDNLQPLHWENNATKGDDYPVYNTSIISKDINNIKGYQRWKVEYGNNIVRYYFP